MASQYYLAPCLFLAPLQKLKNNKKEIKNKEKKSRQYFLAHPYSLLPPLEFLLLIDHYFDRNMVHFPA